LKGKGENGFTVALRERHCRCSDRHVVVVTVIVVAIFVVAVIVVVVVVGVTASVSSICTSGVGIGNLSDEQR
jgi:hypothetical protein